MGESERTQNRDNSALAAWLVRWSKRYLGRQGLRREDCEDISQELAITLWRRHWDAVSECRHGTRPLGWMRLCAARLIARHVQGGQHDVLTRAVSWEDAGFASAGREIADAAPPQDLRIVREEATAILREALDRCGPKERTLLLGHYEEQRSFVELAKETRSTPDAVRMMVKRAAKKVESYMRLQGFDPEDYMALIASTPPGMYGCSTGNEIPPLLHERDGLNYAAAAARNPCAPLFLPTGRPFVPWSIRGQPSGK